jgi:glycosyltransferase involved in cell wall biosynthesis
MKTEGELRPLRLPAAPAASVSVDAAMHARVPQTAGTPASLKILHVFRAPLGGLFRHVIDITQGQIARGHRVGLIVDSLTGGERADAILAALEPDLALGLTRIGIPREMGFADVAALRCVARRLALTEPDVLHGHGAKGGALARLALGASNAIRAYTPHGGSLVYRPGTFKGRFYRALEWLLKWRTDLFLFESAYIAELYRAEIGPTPAMTRVVRNGVGAAEFAPITPQPDATDIVCVGELRPVKAIDTLIEALAALRQCGRSISATIAGEGPQGDELKALAIRLGVGDQVRFAGHRAAREAFAMGRMLVIPSRAESLPYVVLEAAAAGMPIIATRVGGVPEIFGPHAKHLIAPDNTTALIEAIDGALANPDAAERVARALQLRVRSEFSATTMVENGLVAYREAVGLRHLARLA